MAEKIGKCKIGEADEDEKLCNDEQGAFGRTEDSRKKKNRRKKRKSSAKDSVIFSLSLCNVLRISLCAPYLQVLIMLR